ncbi:MAG: hypothetical protein AAGA48_34340 [Myxococcota bacterium]
MDMKVVCDNCRSAYRVPDEKLQKPINKAVCRGCGFRLMIPRPKPGHDPDQRTLVSAVPPKKAGATDAGRPERTGSGRSSPGRSSPGRSNPNRSSPPARGRAAAPGSLTSMAPPPKLDPETAPIQDVEGHGLGPNLSSIASAESETAVRAPSPRSHPSMPSAPGFPARNPSHPSMPRRPAPSMTRQPNPPSMERRSLAPQSGRVARPQSVPGPDPRMTGPALQPHNPAMDVAWSLVGLGVAGVGILVGLATLIVDHPVVVFAGSGMVVGGVLLSLLVMITGRRGQRPARIFFSLSTSAALASVVALSIVSARFALASNHIWARTPPPLPPPTPADEAETAENRNPTGLPVEAVQPLVENNLDVKRCFVPMFRTNTLPSRVDVAFTISPNGKAREVKVNGPDRFVGSKLEKCLAKAIRGIEFPKSTGKGTSFVYPLIIR